MYVKLTIPERLKDLRVERGLTLEQLAEQTGISKSALGKYETDDYKDISPFSIAELAKFYGVSTDYLMGLTETKNHPNTDLHDLHLSDEMIELLKSEKLNHRLLCELVTHEGFQRFLVDAEIYVDRIADMRVQDMNTVLKATRQQIIREYDPGANDLHLRTLELAQITEDDFFDHVVHEDMDGILHDIRDAHRKDKTTAEDETPAQEITQKLEEALNFEGSPQEQQIRSLMLGLGIDYDSLTKEEFVTLVGILSRADTWKIQQNLRGKTPLYQKHGKSKRHK